MLSRKIYKSFLTTVVRDGVFSESELARGTLPLGNEITEAIRSQRRVDHRLPYLARISGKGGTDSHGNLHKAVRNVSLLEHATSIARGALVFAEQDLRAIGEGSDESALSVRLARVVAVGFLHDADKMVGRGRTLLNAEIVAELMRRYCVDAFLAEWSAGVSSNWMVAMIDHVEISRAGRLQPGGVMLRLSDRADAGYIRCADRVEGKLLADGPYVALSELENFKGFCAPSAFRERWQVVDIFQPHIPFLLDALQIGFANGCKELASIPPLFETHQDGRLIVVLPSEHFKAICEHALAEVGRRFLREPRISVNNRWSIELKDGRTTVHNLPDAFSEKSVAARILPLASALVAEDAELCAVVDETFGKFGFSVAWPHAEKLDGAMAVLSPTRNDTHHENVFEKARMLAVCLRCTNPKASPDPCGRETALLDLLKAHQIHVPSAIQSLKDPISRRSLLSLVTGGASVCETDLDESVFGHAGLLEQWLGGPNGFSGLNAGLPKDVSEQYIKPVREMLVQAIEGRFVSANEGAPRRCHFTNVPVNESAIYKSKSEGIYALKVSAFSGREGRPESHRSTRRGTYLSPLARTEHALRFFDNNRRDGKAISFLLSSPSMSGLFASLTLGADTAITEISTYELRTLDTGKLKRIFSAFDSFERRILIGRYEYQETGLAAAVDMVLRIVEASLRTGRPIHVFQGTPHEVFDRVYFDALPHEIESGLGRRGFRIEDLESACDQLRTWQQVCGVPGLGVAMATAMMDPKPRLAALCEAVEKLDRAGSNNYSSLRFKLHQQAQELIMTDETASPIVRFAQAMTGFQSAPHRGSSQSDRSRGMRLALEALDSVCVAKTTDRETVVCAVVAEIENAAERETDKQFTALREGDPTHKEALTRAAEIFADEVFPSVFRGRAPESKARRSAVGIYRVAFERAHQLRRDGKTVFPA